MPNRAAYLKYLADAHLSEQDVASDRCDREEREKRREHPREDFEHCQPLVVRLVAPWPVIPGAGRVS